MMIGAMSPKMEENHGRTGARVIPLEGRAFLERHRAGDPTAFPALVATFRSSIYGYLTRCGVALSERDDLFQEVFLRVHRAASEASPTGPVAPWVFAIAVNIVRTHFRRTKVRAIVQLDGAPDADVATLAPGPDHELEARRTVAWLEARIACLPLEQREALVLCAIEGMELRDAADALGVPVDTVKTRLRRARIALAEARAKLDGRAEREESR
jgi:RNA polymerase sigma-70 factor (ECF subfamily)